MYAGDVGSLNNTNLESSKQLFLLEEDHEKVWCVCQIPQHVSCFPRIVQCKSPTSPSSPERWTCIRTDNERKEWRELDQTGIACNGAVAYCSAVYHGLNASATGNVVRRSVNYTFVHLLLCRQLHGLAQGDAILELTWVLLPHMTKSGSVKYVCERQEARINETCQINTNRMCTDTSLSSRTYSHAKQPMKQR